MKPIVPILIGAAALLALGAGGGGGQQSGGSGAGPQRVPSVPPGKPATTEGEERNDDEGRTWATYYVNRDEAKHYEMVLLSVASSPSNAAIGSGELVVDVYETIIANADWQWQGQSCERSRWILQFEAGRLMSARLFAAGGGCLSVRPPYEVWGRKLHWIQIGSSVRLVVDTKSGMNHQTDSMIAPRQVFADKSTSEFRPGKYSGTGVYSGKRDNPQWFNGNVSSGYVTLDASWIFTPA